VSTSSIHPRLQDRFAGFATHRELLRAFLDTVPGVVAELAP